MKEIYEMPWKPPRRTLHNAFKLKLPHGQPLPESVDDATPVNEELVVTGQTNTLNNNNNTFSGFLSALPIASPAEEDNYFAKFNKTPEFDHGDDAEFDHLFFSDLGGAEGSTLDNSSASFLSWADEIELREAAKNKAFLDELEGALLDEEAPTLKDQELLNECVAWKNRHILLRVLGKGLSCFQNSSEDSTGLEVKRDDVEDEGEIIASHGCVEECTKTEPYIDSDADRSTVRSANLMERVKVSALEKLTLYALSEALKSFEEEQQTGSGRQNVLFPADDASSALANLSEDLGRALQISGRSIRRSPKLLSVELEKKSLFPSSPEHIQLGVPSKRFLSNIDSIPEDKICIDSSLSVLGISKPLNSEFFSSKMKTLEKRAFHSAADRKRPGILDRRFSCVSPEHDRLLKPLENIEERARKTSAEFHKAQKSKQISVPNTPLKLLRHLTLPPIQNLNSYNKLSVESQEKNQSPITHIRRIFVKNKVALTPLPNAVNTPEEGLLELQIAKQMLESTPDFGRWSSCRKLGFSGIQNIKSRKKSTEKY